MTNEKKTQYTPTASEKLRDRLTKELANRQTARQTTQTDSKTDKKTARQTDRKTDRKNPHDVLKTVEAAFLEGTIDKHTNELQLLSYIIALTVLNKCISVSDNDTLRLMKADLTRAKETLEKITYNGTIASELKPNKDGVLKSVILNKSANEYLSTASRENLGGDGIDLLQVAVLSIYDEWEKAKTENRAFPGWLETPYNTRKLSRKIYIEGNEIPTTDGECFETVTTTPIQQCYKTVRKEIQSNKALSFNSGYTYISIEVYNEENSIDEIIYKRYGKYANIGGYMTDGTHRAYKDECDEYEHLTALIKALNLTARQTAILEYRLKGYGNKAIANTLGVRKETIKDHIKKIRKAITDSGIFSAEAIATISILTLDK